jgi:hypothetical protein
MDLLFLKVSSLVIILIAEANESFATVIAGIGLDLGMGPKVYLQILLRG